MAARIDTSRIFRRNYTNWLLVCACCSLPILSSLGWAGRGDESEKQRAQTIKTAGQRNAAALNTLDGTRVPPAQRQQIQQQIAERNAQIDAGVKQFPDSPLVNTAASGAALASRDVGKALGYGDRAVKLSLDRGEPGQIVDAYKARAQARLAEGDKAGALSDIESALERDKNDAELIALRGLIGGHAPAKDYKLMTFKGGDQQSAAGQGPPAAAASGGEAPGGGAPAKTAETAKVNLDAQETLKDAEGGMALDPKKSRALLEDLLKRDPTNAKAYALKAKADRLIGDYQAAHDDASAAVGLDSKLAAAYAERAVAGALLGRPEKEVAADWSHAAELDPDADGAYREIYARALARAGLPSATSELAALARGGRQERGEPSSSGPGGSNGLASKDKALWLWGLLGAGLAAAIAWRLYRRAA